MSDVVLKEGFFLINAIHPKAVVVEDAKIGKGVVIPANLIVYGDPSEIKKRLKKD